MIKYEKFCRYSLGFQQTKNLISCSFSWTMFVWLKEKKNIISKLISKLDIRVDLWCSQKTLHSSAVLHLRERQLHKLWRERRTEVQPRETQAQQAQAVASKWGHHCTQLHCPVLVNCIVLYCTVQDHAGIQIAWGPPQVRPWEGLDWKQEGMDASVNPPVLIHTNI